MVLKCAWCKKSCMIPISVELTFRETTINANFCSIEHLEEAQRFFKYAEAHLTHFLLGLILPGIVGLILVILNQNGLGVFVILAGIGTTSIIFPFATPQTNELFGFKTAILLVQILGIILIGFGFVFWLILS